MSALGVIGTVLLLISPCLIIGAGVIWWDIDQRRPMTRVTGPEHTVLLEQWHDLFPDMVRAMNEGRISPGEFEEFVRLADPEE